MLRQQNRRGLIIYHALYGSDMVCKATLAALYYKPLDLH
jgi:hypothetical protein